MMLLITFLTLTTGNITWIVYQYIEFGGCSKNVWIITLTVVAAVLMYGLILLRTRNDASALTSSIVLAYCLYLQWSALSSDNNA